MKDELLNYIYDRMPTQKKKIGKCLEENPQMQQDLEDFLQRYSVFMELSNISIRDLAEAYLELIHLTMHARVEFVRTGRYPAVCQQDAINNVYANPAVMTNYMLGLALSQFVWKHHYIIFQFYDQYILNIQEAGRLLEIGSGHGLYTLKLLSKLPFFEHLDIVDISDTSLKLTQDIIAAINPASLFKVRFHKQDITRYMPIEKYDFITMGEVLEHVEDPLTILQSLKRLMHQDSRLFITTCANSPALDHVYHFTCIDDIRNLLKQAGYHIVTEVIAPSEDKSPDFIVKHKLAVSYAAILKREE